METLNLDQAALFLKMNPEVLRRKAKGGNIPGRKAGKCWIFIKEHLADWVSGRYPDHGRELAPVSGAELRVIDGGKQQPEDIKQCQSTSGKKRGGSNTPHQTANEYSNLLGLK